MNFGIKLQKLRKEKGLSQEALAEKLGVSRQAVSKWETGEGYPEMDKLLMISELFQVSLDYLMKDNDNSETYFQQEDQYFMNHQTIEDYMKFKNKFAYTIGASVFMIIMSLNIAVGLSHTQHGSIGAFGMLVVIAIAVALIVVIALQQDKYSRLENKKISMSYQDLQDLQIKQTKFKSYYGMGIALGVCLIIFSTACIILITEFIGENNILAPIQFLTCIACAVFAFIILGIKNDMYRFLVQNREYITKKQENKKSDDLFGITMPLAAMIYLALGFTKNWWHPGWLVFPITVFITLGIQMFMKKDRES